MKKIILIVLTMFFINIYNISCLKNNDSSTSSLALPNGKKVYYYRLCESEYLCKFSCSSEVSIETIKQQDLIKYCNKPVAYRSVIQVSGNSSKEIKNEILDPIQKSNHLEIILVPNNLLNNFNKSFSKKGTVCTTKDPASCLQCTSNCKESDDAAGTNAWLITKEGSNIIYQNATEDSSVSILQWSGLIKNSEQKDTMTYEEAKQACNSYNFKNLSNWSLPSEVQLEKISKDPFDFGKILANYSPKTQFVWSSSDFNQAKVFSLRKKKNEDNFQIVDKNDEYYTICVRNYK